jgi:flagellar hook-associated protein 3 FlgL
MRVSTANRYDAAVDSLQRRQRDMTDAQNQMTSGKRINKPSDDPTGAARAERAYIVQLRITSEQRAVQASRSAMTLAESALGQAGDVLQGARELLAAAGNGSYGASDRKTLADQLTQYRNQLLSLANQGNGADGYLFGGQGASALPFLDAPGGVQPAPSALGGQLALSSSEQMPGTVDGQAIWLGAMSGNGVFVTAAAGNVISGGDNTGTAWITAGSTARPSTGDSYRLVVSGSPGNQSYEVLKNGAPALSGMTFRAGTAITVDELSFTVKGTPADGDSFSLAPSTPSLSVFQALDDAIATLKDPSASTGQAAQAVNSGLRDVDAVMGHLQAARAEAGSALTRLDAIDSRDQDRTLWAKSVQSDAEDADMVQAISEFQNQQTGYQAALQSYASVQRMSLFDYIK